MIRHVALLAYVVAVAAILTASSSQAANMAPMTMANNLTFSRAVMLPGVTLPAGTYVFERDSNPNSGIVRVLTPNYQKLMYLGFTAKVTRPRGFQPAVSLGEAAAGEPLPIIAWYPIGSSQGYQFLYR